MMMRHKDSFIKRAFALPNGAGRPIFKRKGGGGHNYFAAAVRNGMRRSSILSKPVAAKLISSIALLN
ncbi:hypothetical protein [Eikenella halliae]|uniref:hypothetical protein n=1 Tax=Eikenella halliae TaxID=1795832 RepID=UPI003624011F